MDNDPVVDIDVSVHLSLCSQLFHVCLYVTRFGKIRINAATNYYYFFLLTGYTGPEDLDFQV